jgi:predicted RNA-binding Zn ribbon-like protein
VDGLVLPVSLGGHPVLDFCNTRAAWVAPTPKEYLVSHVHLTVWAAHNGLLPRSAVAGLRRAATRAPGDAAAVLDRAVAFRTALYPVLVGPARARDWSTVNAEVRRAAATLTLTREKPSVLVPKATGLELPLFAVVWSAAEFLTTPLSTTVSACPSADCGWLFSDPRGRRRWCSMALCGNRAKVRRHADRIRAAGS